MWNMMIDQWMEWEKNMEQWAIPFSDKACMSRSRFKGINLLAVKISLNISGQTTGILATYGRYNTILHPKD